MWESPANSYCISLLQTTREVKWARKPPQASNQPFPTTHTSPKNHILGRRTRKLEPCFPPLENRLHNLNSALSNWISLLKLWQLLLSLKARARQGKKRERKKMPWRKTITNDSTEKVPGSMGDMYFVLHVHTRVGGSSQISQKSLGRRAGFEKMLKVV